MTIADLEAKIAEAGGSQKKAAYLAGLSLSCFKMRLHRSARPRRGYRQFTVDQVQQALSASDGNRSKAARLLGAPRTTVMSILRRAKA